MTDPLETKLNDLGKLMIDFKRESDRAHMWLAISILLLSATLLMMQLSR